VPHFDATSAECLVFAYKEGLLSAAGHNLMIRVRRFTVTVDDATSAVDAHFDAASLEVVSAVRYSALQTGALPSRVPLPSALSESDKRTIEQKMIEEVLEAARYPEIRFVSSRVTPVGDGFHVEGSLTLHGRTREVAFDALPEGKRLVAEVGLHQPDYGIKPYSALLGALKVKPEVTVRIALPRSAAPP
jgi:polyisoprenoid-binding protein YceI